MTMTDLDLTREELEVTLANLLGSWQTVCATERLSLSAEHARKIADCEWRLDELNRRKRDVA